jgi:hypothetical protein
MFWRKILVFSLLLIIFQITPSTFTSYFWGVSEDITQLRFWGEYIASSAMATIVFIILGFQGIPKPYLHAFCIGTLAFLVTTTIVTLLIGEFTYTILSVIENTFTLIAMLLGTYIGLSYSHKNQMV